MIGKEAGLAFGIHTGLALVLLVLPGIFFWPLSSLEFLYLLPLQALFYRQGWPAFMTGLFLVWGLGALLTWGLGLWLGSLMNYPTIFLVRGEDLLGKGLVLLILNAPLGFSGRMLYKVLALSFGAVLLKFALLLVPGIFESVQREMARFVAEKWTGVEGAQAASSLIREMNSQGAFEKVLQVWGTSLWALEFVVLGYILRQAQVWMRKPGQSRSFFEGFRLPGPWIWGLLGALAWIILSWWARRSGTDLGLGYGAMALMNLSALLLLLYGLQGAGWLLSWARSREWGPGIRMFLNVGIYLFLGWTGVFILFREMDLTEVWPALVLPLVGALSNWISLRNYHRERE